MPNNLSEFEEDKVNQSIKYNLLSGRYIRRKYF